MKIYFVICANTVINLVRYILKFGQIIRRWGYWAQTMGLILNRAAAYPFTNTLFNLDKYIFWFEEIHFTIWTIHLAIWRNSSNNLEKYILATGPRIWASPWTVRDCAVCTLPLSRPVSNQGQIMKRCFLQMNLSFYLKHHTIIWDNIMSTILLFGTK